MPRDERVLAFGSASLVYTVILSLWNAARARSAPEAAAAGTSSSATAAAAAAATAPLELCDLAAAGDEACEPLPRPPRAAAGVPFGLRRGLVRARRGAAVALGGGRRRPRAPGPRMMDDGRREPPAAQETAKNATAFAWGGAEGDEALRLPRGVAAAERLAARRPSPALSKPTQPPPEVREARKDPLAVFAVLLIITWQLIGSLIGLTRDVLPEEYQRPAVMDEPAIERRDET